MQSDSISVMLREIGLGHQRSLLRGRKNIFRCSADIYLTQYFIALLNEANGAKRHRQLKNLKSVALVRKRTIPTERPPLVGEVSASFCG
jgi:hypothetical protein